TKAFEGRAAWDTEEAPTRESPSPAITMLGSEYFVPPSDPQTARRRRRVTLILVSVGLVLLAAGAIALLVWSFRSDAPAPARVVVTEPEPAQRAALPSGEAEIRTVALESLPTEAEVYLGTHLLGRTPARINLPRSTVAVQLLLRHRGFPDQRLKVVP